MKPLGLLMLLLTACAHPRPAGQPPVPQGPVERTLGAVAGGAEIPADLSVTYSDMHGMWGGSTIVVSATGAYEWKHLDPREGVPERIQGTITEEQLRALVGLLVELRAWRQETPDRPPVPDESSAGLTIRAGGGEARIWEWYNDMPANNRLSRIRDRMVELRNGLQPGSAPRPER